MTESVLFRVDAGPGIGLGHLQRCLSLAAAFAESGWAAAFLVNDRPLVSERVAAAGFTVARLAGAASWSTDDADRVVEEMRTTDAAVVVVDSDLESPAYMRRVKSAGVTLCAVEDNSQEEVVADVLLNGDAHARRQTYRSATGDTEYLLGPEYAPLAPEYWATAGRPITLPPQSAMVTVGGSDPHGLLPDLVRAAAAWPESIHVHVVIGPFVGRRAEIEAAVTAIRSRVTVHDAPPSMCPIIAACDVALSAAGQTMYELAALGRPVVAIELAANQHLQLEEFVRAGAAIGAGAAGEPGLAARAATCVAELAASPARCRAMADAGRMFVDGHGARRAVRALLAHRFASPGGSRAAIATDGITRSC